MAWTLNASGTQTAVISTIHTLATSTTNGVFVYEVDITTLVLGDTLVLKVNGITLAGGAAGQMWKATYNGPQANVRVQTMAIASDISINVTLQQTTGTGRAFPWKLILQ